MQDNQNHSLGIYIHWPFCLSKCPYCDFKSTPTTKIKEELLLKGYTRDILYFKKHFENLTQIKSIFFGGGTPSLMSAQMLENIMNTLHKHFQISTKAEISLEANPDAIDLNKMQQFKQLGINRLSIGVQALDEKALKFLGRRHSLKTALERIEEAKTVFNNINADFIYARPNQKLKDWENELLNILKLNLPHYSLYQLIIEEGTPFYKQGLNPISDTQANKLYKLTEEIMQTHNRPAYEISNYAKKGFECKHNLLYWKTKNYIGIGPAAHGRINLIATENAPTINEWLIKAPNYTQLSKKEKKLEELLMHIRLVNKGFPTSKVNPLKLVKAQKKGWIYIKNKHLFTTQKGRIMLNQLILLLSDD